MAPSSAVLLPEKRVVAISNALRLVLKTKLPSEGASITAIYARLDINTKKSLSKADIQSALENGQPPLGKIVKLPNGNYKFADSAKSMSLDRTIKRIPAAPKPQKNAKPSAKKVEKVVPVTPAKAAIVTRERSERKRVQKVVFDPSDVEPVKKKRVVPKLPQSSTPPKSLSPELVIIKEIDASPGLLCKVCYEGLSVSQDSAYDETMTCEDCNCRVHASCTKVGDIRQSRWRCEDCKMCTVCRGKKASPNEPLIQCMVCGESYHVKCVKVKKMRPSQDWLCSTCKRIFPTDPNLKDDAMEEAEVKESVDATVLASRVRYNWSDAVHSDSSLEAVKTTVVAKSKAASRRQSRDSNRSNKKKIKEEDEDPVPDCSEWTPEQVHAYFMLFVPAESAKVFLDQEIDGKILLLLRRSEVLTKFNLKIGPALKVYSLVKRLQKRDADIRLSWH